MLRGQSEPLMRGIGCQEGALEDGRTAEDGTCCGACQQVETVKKRNSKRKSQERQKALTNKGGFGL